MTLGPPEGAYADADAARLASRLRKYCDNLLTFLDRPDLPFENNLTERMIRPAVMLRKNSQSKRGEKGAAVQAVLMTLYRTLQLRGHDPLQIIPDALRRYLSTGTLPPLPEPIAAAGRASNSLARGIPGTRAGFPHRPARLLPMCPV